MNQKHRELLNAVKRVMDDGSRMDRWLARSSDGELYLTTRDTSATQYGPIMVVEGADTTDEDVQGVIDEADLHLE